MKVYFSFPGDKPDPGDWIGYFPVGTDSYMEWYWVKDLGGGCSATFTARGAGNYEFRYLLKGGYDQVTARAGFRIVQ
ncbi:MAG TPA: hypothetical protein VF721_13905 [Pyrinomonadaceae bacterium]